MIVKSVVLPCAPERAFALFTERAGDWWPPDRRHSKDPSSIIRIESSGRFFERGGDGTEIELGVVREFVAPRRLLIDWHPGTDADHPTELEVRFDATDAGTRVTITHGPGVAGIDRYNQRAATYARSWDLVLAALQQQV
jgi:uncharacterized protein YndB with AHSA1/START domain